MTISFASLNNLKITHKISASFVLIVAIVLGLVAFSTINVKNIDLDFDEYEIITADASSLMQMEKTLAAFRLAAVKFRLSQAEADKDHALSYAKKLGQETQDFEDRVKDPKIVSMIDVIAAETKDYLANFAKVIEEQERFEAIMLGQDKIGPAMRGEIDVLMSGARQNMMTDALFAAATFQENFLMARFKYKAFMDDNKQETLQDGLQHLGEAKKYNAQFAQYVRGSDLAAKSKELAGQLDTYEMGMKESGEAIRLRNEAFDVLNVLGPKIKDGYGAIYEQFSQDQERLGANMQSSLHKVIEISIVVGVAIALLCAFIAFTMARMLSKNIALVIGQMQRLSQGDLSFEVEGAERGDEIGTMAKALVVFRQNGQEVKRLEEEQKITEQRQAEERRAAMMKMADEFDSRVGSIVEGVANAASQMRSMSAQLAAAIEETTVQSSSVAAASEQATVNVQTVAAASEELTASIREIARNVQDTAHTAKACASAARTSQEHLKDLQNAIGEIDGVIQSINDVAEQTNLLALNATIEAARAGEAGKGFAVVASEVKSLANETHKMTGEITEKVMAVKKTSEATIEAINSILQQIEAVDGKTNSVAAAVEEQSASTNEISRNVQEAATGTQEVSTNIQHIQSAANNSASATQHLETSSESLSQQADSLKNSVVEFLKEVRAA